MDSNPGRLADVIPIPVPSRPVFSIGLVFAIVAVAVLSAAPRALAAACPAAVVEISSYSGAASFSVDAAVYDSSFAYGNTAHLAFDRQLGTLALEASSGGRLWASERVVETFDLVGVAPGTSIDGMIEFQLDGYSQQDCGGSGCGVQLEGALTVGADSVVADANQAGPGSLTKPLGATLSRMVTFVAGSPVHAEFALRYGTGPGAGGAMGKVTASYRVRGLPPGVQAVTCGGTATTPVRAASWGELKSRYR
jgi:hypothetical protein